MLDSCCRGVKSVRFKGPSPWPVTLSFLLLTTQAAARFPAIIDFSQTTADVAIFGATPNDKTGYRFTSGDYNGDGSTDVVVLSEGQLGISGFPFFHILWGGVSLPSVVDFANYSGEVSYVRAVTGDDGFWAHVESGDFNGDGIDDIALGMPCTTFNCTGKVYLIFGTPDFPDTIDLTSPTIIIVTLIGIPGGPGFGGFFGWALSAGDINGDAIDDLVIAAPELSPGGQIYVFWGGQAMLPIIEMSNPTTNVSRLIDPRSGSSGWSLACGDVNADGFDDVLIGGSEVMLLTGAATLPDTVLLTTPIVKRYHGLQSFGAQVELADFDGDGYDDSVISMPYSSPFGCEHCGEVTVSYAGETLEDTIVVTAPNTAVTRLFGVGVVQRYGWSLASGDLNGDGYDDLLIGSRPDEYDQGDVGKVTIAYGSASPPDSLLLGTEFSVTRVYAERRSDDFGAGLHSCDVNMDGVLDMLIGAPLAPAAGRARAGLAYVQNGMPESTSVGRNAQGHWILGQNYPNPFNPHTHIPILLGTRAEVELVVYDVVGRPIKTLLSDHLEAGRYQIPWDGTDELGQPVASGIYFYRLVAASFFHSRKMVLLR
ncbi:MAG: FG-GAP-like repeat-containing protein [Candidatus Latescibacteria bacterium]|nr:FG-GAP-like repeat-containing protein [Candidatus Latescibacterota bacterium]